MMTKNEISLLHGAVLSCQIQLSDIEAWLAIIPYLTSLGTYARKLSDTSAHHQGIPHHGSIVAADAPVPWAQYSTPLLMHRGMYWYFNTDVS